MVKQIKDSDESSDVKGKKTSGIFQIVLLWLLIPLLFASAFILVVAKFADINVFEKAKEYTENLPFIGKKKDEEVDSVDLVLEERVVTLQAEIQEKEAQLFKLQTEVEKTDNEKADLLLKQEELQDEIARLTLEKEDSKIEFSGIVTTFQTMSAKSAAPVILNMEDSEAIRILTSLDAEKLAAILEKMPPEDAAKYTTLMTK